MISEIHSAKQSSRLPSVYRYGMLVMCIALLGKWLLWFHGLPAGYPHEKFGLGVVAIMLMLNHLAFQFSLRGPIAKIAQGVAICSMLFSLFYISYSGVRL
ncbi:hypothetical protein JIN85_05965 [Luteolibacter pohnpeiensis]|uniref:Uncharacterized protein n=1 Tax=Luteolibacter pohnpeiensis TaxID=454153 RepID=A0A934S3S0_9BACT|nr:hypothetical protein [Luteolibacter pohnpeiensis]